MINFDSRTFNKHAFQALQALRDKADQDNPRLKEQKNQAQELYTYISTWGLMRLKAEEKALSQEGKKQVVKCFFERLATISGKDTLSKPNALEALLEMSANDYLGLTGIAIELANEFGFWANAIYIGIPSDGE